MKILIKLFLFYSAIFFIFVEITNFSNLSFFEQIVGKLLCTIFLTFCSRILVFFLIPILTNKLKKESTMSKVINCRTVNDITEPHEFD